MSRSELQELIMELRDFGPYDGAFLNSNHFFFGSMPLQKL